MMKRILSVIGALMLFALPALGEYSPGYLDAPPDEVLSHLAQRWPEYALEDYCEISGTTQGDWGFAMILKGRERILVCYHEEDGRMNYAFKNANAVPQGEEEAWFSKGKAGWYPEDNGFYTDGRVSEKLNYDDGLNFSVTQLDDVGESYAKWVRYRWIDGGFRLTNYKHFSWLPVGIQDGALRFYDNTIPCVLGDVKGSVQTNIRYVSYSTLPKEIEEARAKLTVATGEWFGGYAPRRIKFTGGQKFPVYTGPGEGYARSGNGKGQVSTNDWIEVYGQKDGYILIQYGISSEKNRIGWIEKSALPKDADVPQIAFDGWGERCVLSDSADVTDDPFVSETALATLKPGDSFDLLLAVSGDWCYIEFEKNGKRMCGFLPLEAI